MTPKSPHSSARLVRRTLALALLGVTPLTFAAMSHDLMPAPAQLRLADGRLPVTSEFSVALRGHDDARLRQAIARALRRWEERTGFTFRRTAEAAYVFATDVRSASLVIDCAAASRELPALGEDESYTLEIRDAQAVLRAPTTLGALRGLETLLQLLQTDAQGWFVPAARIEDRPRFPWRGLMIDVCRHWQPMEVIKRNLDGMSLVKLNVLHLHLSEDQGFRIESKTHPELHERGSDGLYFTQDEIREIIAYAADRGIRVVPEFDIPGHATSWVVSHPELASAPGPYEIERRWGIFDPVLDPTNEQVYALLADVLGEMAALFPDPYFHIGGDENNGKQWNANPRIQAFIRDRGLKDNEGLHAWFNQRIRDIMTKHGKKLVGWDEILHPDLPKDAIVHSWRGPKGLAAAANQGHAAILSNGYYIDLCFPASQHYANDPLPADTPLTAVQQAMILGGEATMWSEWVTLETIDSRIWPRTAAIAERLWSPREVNDVDDMYRRLAIVGRRLEEAGLNQERNRPAMLRRLAGPAASPDDVATLTAFVDVIEPVKEYQRGQYHQNFTQFTPLVTLADCARPESDAAREFSRAVDALLAADGKARQTLADAVRAQLQDWELLGRDVAELLAARAQIGRAGLPVAQSLADASAIGLAAMEALTGGDRKSADWREAQLAALERAAAPHDAIQLPAIEAIRKLVRAAAVK